MNILAMDTSGPSLSVALLLDQRLVYRCLQQNGLTHSDSLMTLVDEALRAGRVMPSEMDCFAVTRGPGSFTGVRIGAATAKAFSLATGKPCYGANALEALAAGVSFFDGVVCAMQDARAGQVYAAAYEGVAQCLPDEAVRLDAFLQKVRPLGRCCFVGDGAAAHRGSIAEVLGERACFAPPEQMAPDAAVVARLCAKRQSLWQPGKTLQPYYLRAPQAERERLAKETAHG